MYEAYAQFDVSLKQTGAGYFDFYLLHNLGEARTEYFDKFDMWNWVAEKKVAGLIKHVGFSFHSTPEELEAINIMRKALNGLKPDEATDRILDMFSHTRNNVEFVNMVKKNRFI